MESDDKPVAKPDSLTDRRSFLESTATAAMCGGLLASYGTFVAYAGRFLYPSEGNGNQIWQYVVGTREVQRGQSLHFTAPDGAKIVVARQGDGDAVEDFIALSSICPHLGCQVHWETSNQRFFCPCHNGAFDAHGRPTEGPPAKANQALTQFPLRVEKGQLFILVGARRLIDGTT